MKIKKNGIHCKLVQPESVYENNEIQPNEMDNNLEEKKNDMVLFHRRNKYRLR